MTKKDKGQKKSIPTDAFHSPQLPMIHRGIQPDIPKPAPISSPPPSMTTSSPLINAPYSMPYSLPSTKTEISGHHPFVQEFTTLSPYCGAMVMRDGFGDPCGKLPEDPIHSPLSESDQEPGTEIKAKIEIDEQSLELTRRVLELKSRIDELEGANEKLGESKEELEDENEKLRNWIRKQQLLIEALEAEKTKLYQVNKDQVKMMHELRASGSSESTESAELARYKEMHENQVKSIRELREWTETPSHALSEPLQFAEQPMMQVLPLSMVVEGNKRVVVTIEVQE